MLSCPFTSKSSLLLCFYADSAKESDLAIMSKYNFPPEQSQLMKVGSFSNCHPTPVKGTVVAFQGLNGAQLCRASQTMDKSSFLVIRISVNFLLPAKQPGSRSVHAFQHPGWRTSQASSPVSEH